MHAQPFILKTRARTREYHTVIKAAQWLGFDAGLELYAMEAEVVPKRPSATSWLTWDPRAAEHVRRTTLEHNAALAYCTGRAAGFEDSMVLDMWDTVNNDLRAA